jgi:butyrate kinase
MSTVLGGTVDAVVLTGGLAGSEMLSGWITERVKFIAEVKIYPGENEIHALASAVNRVLYGVEIAKDYK